MDNLFGFIWISFLLMQTSKGLKIRKCYFFNRFIINGERAKDSVNRNIPEHEYKRRETSQYFLNIHDFHLMIFVL